MKPGKQRLIATLYAPPLEGKAMRLIHAIDAIENVLAPEKLRYGILHDGSLQEIHDRITWLEQAAQQRRIPVLTNGNEERYISVMGMEIPAALGPGGDTALLQLSVEIPQTNWFAERSDGLLMELGRMLGAFWGTANPYDAAVVIGKQTIHPRQSVAPPKGLVALKPLVQIPDPFLPQCLGWINYWSKEAARMIGFPDPSQDAAMLKRARQSPEHSWCVRLTQDRLDLDNAQHLHDLQQAYKRFANIGGR